jgi:hypothetical protein
VRGGGRRPSARSPHRLERWAIAPPPIYGTISAVPTLRLAQDAAADELLGRDPLALLIGMLLDQHMRHGSSGVVGLPE